MIINHCLSLTYSSALYCKQHRIVQALAETAAANKALKAFKAREAERDAAADAAIEAYAERKAATLAERRRREDARAAEKDAQRKAMVRTPPPTLSPFRITNLASGLQCIVCVTLLHSAVPMWHLARTWYCNG